MEDTLHQPAERQPANEVYRKFSTFLGAESDKARIYLAQKQSIVEQGFDGTRLELDDMWKQKEELYARNKRSEITIEELLAASKILDIQRSNTTNHDEAARTIKEYPDTARIEFSADKDVIQRMNDLLQKAHSLDDSTGVNAPFNAYSDNTNSVWKYVDNQTIKNFLKSKPFVVDTMLHAAYDDARSITNIHNGQTSNLFEVPTRLMVNAAAFTSWLGREDRDGHEGFGEKSISLSPYPFDAKSVSLNAIKAYASHPTNLPYVGQVEVYVQPNGLAFASNGSGDSHRIGAAILRGQETIMAKDLTILLLKDNFLTS